MPRSHAAVDPQAPQADAEPIDAKNTLPLDLMSMMSVLQPGDAEPLARLLASHPSFREQILERAAATLGNKTVQDALAIGSGPGASPAPGDAKDAAAAQVQSADAPTQQAGAPSAQDAAAAVALYADDSASKQAAPQESAAQTMDELTTDAPGTFGAVRHLVWSAETAEDLAMILKSYPQHRQQIIDEAQSRHRLSAEQIQRAIGMADAPAAGGAAQEQEQQKPPEPAPGEPQPGDAAPGLTAPDPTKEAAWIGQARAYNASHSHYVDEFLGIVGPSVLDDQAMIDPAKVAQWQEQNGLVADGKVGPHTVAAARQLKPRPDATKAAQNALPDDDLRKEAV